MHLAMKIVGGHKMWELTAACDVQFLKFGSGLNVWGSSLAF